MPRLSVLIPFFNAHRYLEECLDSVYRSRFEDLEIVIFDDGSNPPLDPDTAVLRRSPFPLTLHRSSVNTGVGSARSTLIAMARGEYIAWQDADDISNEDRFALQVEYLDEHPDCTAVGTGVIYYDDATGAVVKSETYFEVAPRDDGFSGCCATFMMRRSAFNDIGPFRADMHVASEDVELLLRIRPREAVRNIPELLYTYRQHPDQTTKRPEWLASHTLFFARQFLEASGFPAQTVLDDPKLSDEAKLDWLRRQRLVSFDRHAAGSLLLEHSRLRYLAGALGLKEFLAVVRRHPHAALQFARAWIALAFPLLKRRTLFHLARLRQGRHTFWPTRR